MNAVSSPETENSHLNNIPLRALRQSTRQCLCDLLNATKLIPSEEGVVRDWRGLSCLVGVSISPTSKNPTSDVLNAWEQAANAENPATFRQLQNFLGQLDRWDAYDDTKEMMENDAQEYLRLSNATPAASSVNERDIITVGDVNRCNQGLPLENYHAFILYADEDTNFANQIVTTLEGEYNMRLCLRERDLLVGHRFEHDAIMRLIATRCARLIVILSPHFVNSKAHQFFFKFAEALSIDEGVRKIVPCVYSRCNISSDFKFYFVLDYSRSTSWENFCLRLRNAIQPISQPALPSPPVSISVTQALPEERCTIEEVSSQPLSRSSTCSSRAEAEAHTQVVRMSDPSALLPPVKTKSVEEPATEPSAACLKLYQEPLTAKPVSPVAKIKKMLLGSKSSNHVDRSIDEAKAKPKKKWTFSSKKKSIAMAESC